MLTCTTCAAGEMRWGGTVCMSADIRCGGVVIVAGAYPAVPPSLSAASAFNVYTHTDMTSCTPVTMWKRG